MLKVLPGLILTLLVLGLVPFVLIARSRASQSDALPPHLVLDMDKQPKFKAQRGSPMFADHRAMRPEIAGTLAREDMWIRSEQLNDPENPRRVGTGADGLQLGNPGMYAAIMLGRIRPAGMTDEQFNAQKPAGPADPAINADAAFYVRKIPAPLIVSADFMKRGQERFNIYCAPCHGEAGYGDGPIAQRGKALRLTDPGTSWTDPQDLNDPKILARPDGHIFNTITNGIRNMPAYDKQISVADRWAIISYVRALELSQNAPPRPAGARPGTTRGQ